MTCGTRKILILLSAVFLCLALGACMSDDEVDKLVVSDVPISMLRDGAYEGEFTTTLVTAKVRVTVAAGRLESVTVLRHRHGPGHGADAIIDRVIAAQSLNVDAVSGATYSSKVVRKAVEIALKKAL